MLTLYLPALGFTSSWLKSHLSHSPLTDISKRWRSQEPQLRVKRGWSYVPSNENCSYATMEGSYMKLKLFVCYRESDWFKKVIANIYHTFKYSWHRIACMWSETRFLHISHEPRWRNWEMWFQADWFNLRVFQRLLLYSSLKLTI